MLTNKSDIKALINKLLGNNGEVVKNYDGPPIIVSGSLVYTYFTRHRSYELTEFIRNKDRGKLGKKYRRWTGTKRKS
jgi:hypothetical protein